MSGQDLVRRLDWDSEFFGRRLARVESTRLDGPGMDVVLASCREQAIDGLYYLVESDARESIRLAERNGFHLADIRITLEHELDPLPPAGAAAGTVIRPGRPADLPALIPIARSAHGDSRFYADPHFDRDRCNALYATWLEKSFHGYAEAVLVAEQGETPVGYITCGLGEGGTGDIGLVGVGEVARGRGVGRGLLAAALRWFVGRECGRARVVTQGGNEAALRLYQGAGFRVRQIQLWYHKWFTDPASAETP